jgi:cell division protein FtsA
VLRRRTHAIEVIGFSHTGSRGMKAGNVVDLAEAEEAVRHAVDTAERAAHRQVESVIVSQSAGRLASELFAASVDITGTAVTNSDIARVLAAGSQRSVRPGRIVMHSLPIGFSLDDARGILDPRGMLGRHFGVDMHVVTADGAAVRNLMLTVERALLSVEAMAASPYVAGLAVLADDEADHGAAVVDMGAGTTTIAVFSSGRFMHADGFALGGFHVTMDLARGLSTSIYDAERIKTLYGSVLAGGLDERDMITVPTVGVDERDPPQFVSRATLTRIIKPRVEEILEMVRDRLAALARGSHRRREPPHRPAGARRPHPRPPGPDRPAARRRRPARGRQGRGLRGRGRPVGLPPDCAPRTLRTATNAASPDRDGGLHRKGRTMASRELLMTGTFHQLQPIGRGRTGTTTRGKARASKRQP